MNPGARKLAPLTLTILSLAVMANAQDLKNPDSRAENCPMRQDHSAADSHHRDVERNGDQSMGFPHDKTTHHFRILPNGGVIEVTANDPADKTNAAAIRGHLAQISSLFSKGDFSHPRFIHGGIRPA